MKLDRIIKETGKRKRVDFFSKLFTIQLGEQFVKSQKIRAMATNLKNIFGKSAVFFGSLKT